MGAFLVGSAGLNSLPLLIVTTALTSSILTFGSLAKLISCTPLGFYCVWEGNFPFSGPCCWLDNLVMELCNSECMLYIFWLSELSTLSIL